jgi:hypothetical protein
MAKSTIEIAEDLSERNASRTTILFFCLVALTLLVLPFSEVATAISNNSAYYLDEGMRLLNGDAPRQYRPGLVARGPLFSYWVAAVLGLGGGEIAAVYFAMKGIYFFILLSAFALTRALSNAFSGYLVVVLCLASPQLYKIGTTIDTTPLFVLFVLEMLRAQPWVLNKKNVVRAGFFLGLALLTKETALLVLLAFPVLYGLWFMRKEKRMKTALLQWGVAFGVFSPWVLWVYVESRSLLPLLGHFNPRFISSYSTESVSSNIALNFFDHFAHHMTGAMRLFTGVSVFFPLLVVTLVCSAIYCIRILRSGLKSRFLSETSMGFVFSFAICALFFLLPLSSIAIGANEDAMRHAFPFFIFLHVLCGCLLPLPNEKILRLRERFRSPRILLATFVILVLVSAGAVFAMRNHEYSKYVRNYSFLPKISGRMTAQQREAAEWLVRHPPPAHMIVTDGVLEEVLGFFSRRRLSLTTSFDARLLARIPDGERLLIVYLQADFESQSQIRRTVSAITQEALLRDLRVGRYAVFTSEMRILNEVFSAVPWASLKFNNGAVFVYEIVGPPALDKHPLVFDPAFAQGFSWLTKQYPAEAESVQREFSKRGYSVLPVKP